MELARREFRRILLIKPSSLGDVVHALPVLHGLRRRYPHARIAWLIAVGCRELLEGHPQIDELIPFDRKRYGQMTRSVRATAAFVEFVSGLRARRFDLVVDLQGLFRSGFLAMATGAPVRIGFARAREFAGLFYSHRIEAGPRDEHAVPRNYRVSRLLGFRDVPIDMTLPVDARARASVDGLLAEHGVSPHERIAVMTPGARWETKVWPAAHFAAVADHLRRAHGLRVVLTGGPAEAADCQAVMAAAREPVVNLCGRSSLSELVALIDRSALLVSNDSGPMHIAAARHRPVIGVFGPTSAARTGPYSPHARVVRRGLPCSPCFLRRRVQCPHGHACLQDLGPAPVNEAADALLAALPVAAGVAT